MMETKLIPLIPISSKQQSLEAALILEPWSYTSPYGTGSDYGYNFCVYVPEQSLALYIRTRHRTTGAEPSGNWRPRDSEKYFDDTKKDIWERTTLRVYHSLKKQLTYLKSLYEPATVGPAIAPPKGLKPDPTRGKKKIFANPTVKEVSFSEADLGLLFKPIRRREDGAGLCDLLYSYVEK